VVEVHADRARVIWGGLPAALSELNLEPRTSEPATGEPVEPAPQIPPGTIGAAGSETLAAEFARELDRLARETVDEELQKTRARLVFVEQQLTAHLMERAKAENEATLTRAAVEEWFGAASRNAEECREVNR